MSQPRRVEYFVSIQQSCMIMPLFRQGYDTLVIANTLALPEHVIANLLAKLRDEGRG
ncbi:hypothetical protein [Bradyrhizobium icense]|uniref:hypothetical protein n=1 Tax=Bradyrhizobium icense TaxID=1274631 RepID=UPI0018D451EC|nr:hypothetical protein [Bradyrhizobium icense]